jgi:hypothetical protein
LKALLDDRVLQEFYYNSQYKLSKEDLKSLLRRRQVQEPIRFRDCIINNMNLNDLRFFERQTRDVINELLNKLARIFFNSNTTQRQMSLKGISEKRKIQMSEKLETYQNEYRCYQLLYEINQIELNRILHRINTLETERLQRETEENVVPQSPQTEPEVSIGTGKEKRKSGTSSAQPQTVPPSSEGLEQFQQETHLPMTRLPTLQDIILNYNLNLMAQPFIFPSPENTGHEITNSAESIRRIIRNYEMLTQNIKDILNQYGESGQLAIEEIEINYETALQLIERSKEVKNLINAWNALLRSQTILSSSETQPLLQQIEGTVQAVQEPQVPTLEDLVLNYNVVNLIALIFPSPENTGHEVTNSAESIRRIVRSYETLSQNIINTLDRYVGGEQIIIEETEMDYDSALHLVQRNEEILNLINAWDQLLLTLSSKN